MGSYALSGEADTDIEVIAHDFLQRWGVVHTEKYILGLHEAFQRLAEFPDIGRDASHIRSGYMRMETASHSVFYRKTECGILIVRVLHQRMDVERHL